MATTTQLPSPSLFGWPQLHTLILSYLPPIKPSFQPPLFTFIPFILWCLT